MEVYYNSEINKYNVHAYFKNEIKYDELGVLDIKNMVKPFYTFQTNDFNLCEELRISPLGENRYVHCDVTFKFKYKDYTVGLVEFIKQLSLDNVSLVVTEYNCGGGKVIDNLVVHSLNVIDNNITYEGCIDKIDNTRPFYNDLEYTDEEKESLLTRLKKLFN